MRCYSTTPPPQGQYLGAGILLRAQLCSEWLWGCRAMAESNAVHTRRPTMRRATAAAAERIYREKFGAADGSVPATFEASNAIAVCAVKHIVMTADGLQWQRGCRR